MAKKNVKKHNLTSKIKIEKKKISDFYNKKFDLIVSNPPYVKSNEIKWLDNDIKNFEPLIALDGGNDGLDVIKKVIYKAKEILKINGLLALEIGNGQYKNVSKILRKNNFIIKHKIKDYGNNIRCVVSRLYYWFSLWITTEEEILDLGHKKIISEEETDQLILEIR